MRTSPESRRSGSRDSKRRLAVFGVLGIILLTATLCRLPGIATSATFLDEGARIAVAAPIAQGSGLYTDVIHFGTPGPILFNALVLRLCGPSVLAVRIAYLLVSLLSLLLLSYIVLCTWGKSAAAVSSTLFALSPLEIFYSYHAMSETLMNLLLLGALAALVTGIRTAPFAWFAVAGALTFASALVKQPGILVIAPVAAFLLLDLAKSKDFRLFRRRSAGFVTGFVGLFLVWSTFLAAGGGWNQWFREMIGSRVYKQASPSEATAFFSEYAFQRGFMILGLFGLALPWKQRLSTSLFRVGALTATAFTLTLPLSYDFGGFSHYLLILEPWWIILAGATTSWLVETVQRANGRLSGIPRAKRFLGLTVIALFLPSSISQMLAARSAVETNATWWRSISEEKEAAARIANADRVLVLANPIYYFHAGVQPPMRPMEYFLVFHLRFFQGAERDQLVLEQLRSARRLFIDSPRWELIQTALQRADAPQLQLIEGPPERPWPRLYQIAHTRHDEAAPSPESRR